MNYTKGEWKLKPAVIGSPHFNIMDNRETSVVAHIPSQLKEFEANAHLIAAAPENFETNSETLRTFRDLRDNHEALWNHIIDEYPGIVNHWDRVKKALAKAKGRGQ